MEISKATLGLYDDEWSRITNIRDGYFNAMCDICSGNIEMLLNWPGIEPYTIIPLSRYGCAAICHDCAKKEGFRTYKWEENFHPDCPDCDRLLGQYNCNGDDRFQTGNDRDGISIYNKQK